MTTHEARARCMSLAESMIGRLEIVVSALALEPDARVEEAEIEAFQRTYDACYHLVGVAYPRKNLAPAIQDHWLGQPGGEEKGERIVRDFERTQHGLRVLRALYGPQVGR